jgi:flagellar M-ring protein FliF
VLKELLSYIQKLGRVKVVLIGFSLCTLIGTLLFYSLIGNKDQMGVLYSELSRDSSEAIMQRLDQENIPYDVDQDGKVIKVDKHNVYKIRALLAREGLPNSGSVIGYEIFDKEESLGTTNFLQNVKSVRARQGELSRTIQAFENVIRARVHLAIPQRELFSKENHRPTASVMLTLKAGAVLSTSEIKAISHLVARSVERLNDKDITIVDTKGNVLQIGGEEDSFGFGASYNMQHRSAYEKRMQSKIETLVSKIVGFGNVEVKVNAEMLFDKVVTNAEIYDPDRAVLRSSHSKEEIENIPSNSGEGGDISVGNNLPDSMEESENVTKYAESKKLEDINNYEISKTIQNTIKEVGTVKQVFISVLINDHYDVKTETFSPRSESDMAKIEELVKAAMGYQETRDDKLIVVHMPFFKNELSNVEQIDQEVPVWWKEHLTSIVNASLVFVAFLTLVLYVLKPLSVRFVSQKSSKVNKDKDFSEDEDLEIDQLQGNFKNKQNLEKIQPKSQDLEKLAEEDPESFVRVLRSWLSQERK